MTQKHQIYAQVLEVDKENSIKQMRQKYFLSFIYSGKWSNIAYPILWVAKVCESLGFAVNLKVKLESIRAEVFSVYQMSVCDLFYSKNRDLSKSDHVCVSESCHERRRSLRTLEKELMLLIRLEKFTKPSLKTLDSTNPQSRLEIQDYCYLPEKWLSNKDHSKAERVIVCEDAKVPRVTSKQLKAFLTLANVNVHEPTIRRTAASWPGQHAIIDGTMNSSKF